ncbi:MAG: polymer-forming cytoskeletal protein [Cytophagaceae bacterium]|jgi:cytoskeletal protein CcmA (bactofilin family)|nr:polymer-forming cytoskeletal protein [Cytophagaceae bacterium]
MFKSAIKKEVEQVISASSMIAQGVVLEGNLETTGNLRIEGTVKGNIKCKSKIALGESSIIEGNLYAQNAEIAGKIVGQIEVTELLVLRSTAIVQGEITASKIVMESGAVFNGTSKMNSTLTKIEFDDERIFKEAKTA